MTDIPSRDDLKCDIVYDTYVLKDIPRKNLRAQGYICRLCKKEHMVITHHPDEEFSIYADVFIRCSPQCGAFVRMRVRV